MEPETEVIGLSTRRIYQVVVPISADPETEIVGVSTRRIYRGEM